MNIEFKKLNIPKENEKYLQAQYHSTFMIDNVEITVPDEIYQFEKIDTTLLIVVDFFSDIKDINVLNLNRNIWCYNEKGEKEWEIMDMFESEEMKNKDTVKYRVEPYTGIWKEEEKIKVSTFGGFTGVLDIKTGKVSNWSWSR